MTDRTASDVMKAMVAMFATGDPAGASLVVAESYLDHQALGTGPLDGIDGFAHVVRTNFAAYERLNVRIEDLFESGDRVAARITWAGRRHSGEEVQRETIDIIRVRDGRAVEHWGGRS